MATSCTCHCFARRVRGSPWSLATDYQTHWGKLREAPLSPRDLSTSLIILDYGCLANDAAPAKTESQISSKWPSHTSKWHCGGHSCDSSEGWPVSGGMELGEAWSCCMWCELTWNLLRMLFPLILRRAFDCPPGGVMARCPSVNFEIHNIHTYTLYIHNIIRLDHTVISYVLIYANILFISTHVPSTTAFHETESGGGETWRACSVGWSWETCFL